MTWGGLVFLVAANYADDKTAHILSTVLPYAAAFFVAMAVIVIIPEEDLLVAVLVGLAVALGHTYLESEYNIRKRLYWWFMKQK
jgi:hypothetical protein